MSQLITTYLEDHHAGSVAGLDAFERVAKGHSDEKVREVVARLADEVREDQAALEEIMAAFGCSPSRLKDAAAKVGEKAARLKPNERAVARSPLSDVVELESLELGVHGKKLGFQALQRLEDPRLDQDHLEELITRAMRQEAELHELRRTQLPKLLSE